MFNHVHIIKIISDREGNRAGLGENGTLKCIYFMHILMNRTSIEILFQGPLNVELLFFDQFRMRL